MGGTVLDVCTDALQAIGQLGAGQTPSPEDGALGLRLLNLELPKLAVQRLYLWNVTTRQYSLVANTRDYTLGPTGSLGGVTRPNLIESCQINPTGSLWLPISVWDKTAWDAQINKGSVADMPEGLYVDYSVGNLGLHFNPAPSGTPGVRLGCWEALVAFTSLFDNITDNYPPEYEEFLEALLAMKYASFYDQPITDSMTMRFTSATAAVQSINAQRLQKALTASGMSVAPNIGMPIPTGSGNPPPATGQG